MKMMYADFNAMTEADGLRLTTRGSQDDIRRLGIRPGDWVWLTDSELVVGVRVDEDPYYGVVATPRWDTLVHLDDDDAKDFARVWAELQQALRRPGRGADEEARVFQLLTIVEAVAPPQFKAATPSGYMSLRRAGALHFLGEPELALMEIEEALGARPDDPDVTYFYLESLRRIDPDRAAIEAESRAEAGDASAPVLAACINIWSAAADQLPDERFAAVGRRVLDWVDRFERAPGRDRVRASVLAQVQFNRGLLLLRLGRRDEARDALHLAHATDPVEPAIGEASALDVFDDRARGIAARLRGKPPTIAA